MRRYEYEHSKETNDYFAQHLGLQSLQELEAADHIVIPERVLQLTSRAVQTSHRELQEVYYVFDMSKRISIMASGKSKQVSFSDNAMSLTCKITDFQKDNLCYFHTHPTFSKERFQMHGISEKKLLEGFPYPIDLVCSMMNVKKSVFSASDIQNLIQDRRTLKQSSILLGTIAGYHWIIAPSKGTFLQRSFPGVKEYGNHLQNISVECIKALEKERKSKEISEYYTYACSQIQKEFCKKNGLWLFSNEDPQSRTLNRMC